MDITDITPEALVKALGLAEAKRFRTRLDIAIDREEAWPSTGPTKPVISHDGFLYRDGLRAFMAQFYPKPSDLDRHSGRLHAFLIKASVNHFGHDELVSLCRDCGRSASDACLTGQFTHMTKNGRKRMGIQASDIPVLAVQCADMAYLQENRTIKYDLDRLAEYLSD